MELDRLVLKLMAKDPAERYQSAGELLAELARLRELLQITSTGAVADAGPSASRQEFAQTELADERPEVPQAPDRFAGSKVAQEPAAGLSASVVPTLARLSMRLMIAAGAACLLIGAVAGWTTRSPDVMAVATDPVALLPGLWLEPRWVDAPRQDTAEDQLHYALLVGPARRTARRLRGRSRLLSQFARSGLESVHPVRADSSIAGAISTAWSRSNRSSPIGPRPNGTIKSSSM